MYLTMICLTREGGGVRSQIFDHFVTEGGDPDFLASSRFVKFTNPVDPSTNSCERRRKDG